MVKIIISAIYKAINNCKTCRKHLYLFWTVYV